MDRMTRRRPKSAAEILRNRKRESETPQPVATRRKTAGNHEVEDHDGKKYNFRDPDIASLFSTVDAIQERIQDKYFEDDIEYEEGVKLAKRIKANLRRFNNDLILLSEIQKRGMPDIEDD